MDSNILSSSSPPRQSITAKEGPGLQLVKGDSRVENGQSDPLQNKEITASKEIDATDIKEKLEDSVNRLNDLVQTVSRDLQFSIDDTSGETVITVLDSSTEKVIRQIPSEEVMALSQNFDSLKGVLFSAEV